MVRAELGKTDHACETHLSPLALSKGMRARHAANLDHQVRFTPCLLSRISLQMKITDKNGLGSKEPSRVTSPMAEDTPEPQHQVVQRSRWQAIVSEAGGISAAVSEESMRRLKFCLQWLQV
jgi:hypothetical protein